jgi:tetratricopeptide (TPR) repeat protein
LDERDLNKEIEVYSKMLESDPTNLDVLGKRGFAYSSKGDFEKAILDYETCVSIDPNSLFGLNLPDEYYFYANKLLRGGDYNKAIINYTHIINHYPDCAPIAWVYCNRAEAYVNIKEYGKAKSDLEISESYISGFSENQKSKILDKIKTLINQSTAG